MRWLLALSAAAVTIVVTLAVTLYLVTDTQKVLRILEKTVAEETGGKLSIADLNFNAFYGFTGKNIRFEPPNIDGSPRKSPAKEFIQINEVRLHYNLWSILYGTLHVTRANAKGGLISIKAAGSDSEFQGISAFRVSSGKDLPDQPSENNTPPEPTGKLIRKFSKLFWIPIRLKLSKIGVEHIDFNIINNQQNITLRDTSALINLTAYWRHLDLESKLSVAKAQIASLDASSLDATLKLRVIANQRSNGFDLEGVHLGLLNNSVQSDTTLKIAPTNENDHLLQYEGKHVTRINLQLHQSIAKLIPTPVTTAGTINLAVSKYSGKINPSEIESKIQNQKFNEILPDELVFTAEGTNIKANAPALGIAANNTNFRYVLTTSRVDENNVKASSSLSQTSDSISLSYKNGEHTNRAFIDNIKTSINLNAHFPMPSTITTNIKVDISGIGVDGQSFEKVSVPVSFEANGDTSDSLKSMFLHQRLKIGDLFTQELIAKCTERCSSFQATSEANIPSVEKAWRLARTNVARMIIPKFVPDKLEGRFTSKSEISGILKSDPFLHPAKALENMRIRYNTATSIEDLSISIPSNQIAVNGASLQLSVSGTERTLATTLANKINEIRAITENKSRKPQEFKVSGFSAKTNLNASIPQFIKPEKIIDALNLSFTSDVGVESVHAQGILAKPLTNIEVTTNGSTNRLRQIALESLKITIPDLTTTIETSADLSLSEEKNVENFVVSTKVSLSDIPEDLVAGLTGNGNLHTEMTASSRDMENISIQGIVDLNDISVNFQNPKNPNFNISLEKASGTFPIQQQIQLNTLQTFATTPKKPSTLSSSSEEDASKRIDLTSVDDESILASANSYLTKTKPTTRGDTRIALNQDYANFREFYVRRRPIKIGSVKLMNLSIDNIEVDAELSQNQFAINNAVASFLGGKIHADFKMAFDNRPSSLKTAFHVTRLNTERLVKSVPGLRRKAKTILSSNNPLIDGAVHLNYDLRTGDMQGGMNLTSIGKDQLRMILYYIDPGDRDATISAIKTALNFGDVKLVSVPIKNGEIGLDVSLRLLAAPIPTPKLQGFPIAKLIDNFREQGEASDDAAH